jgi:hypothetical protein
MARCWRRWSVMVVALRFASWNQLVGWLRRMEGLRAA